MTRPSRQGRPTRGARVIGVEYVGGDTLAEELRQHGPLTIHELERLGEDLFQAITFLDKRGVWHRDIKPDNLALRELERKGRELVLFDFSLAGTPDTDLIAGTQDYLDPFLGPPNRMRYDQAAELYAVAVTLHEMASGELPSWGDDLADARFLDPAEEVQLAEDLFDPVARDGLVEFFKAALHRDAARRFANAARDDTGLDRRLPRAGDRPAAHHRRPPRTRMTRRVPREPAPSVRKPPASSARKPCGQSNRHHPAGRGGSVSVRAVGRAAAPRHRHRRRPGPRPRQPHHRLRGIGSVPRYELVRLSREWRQRFSLTEAGPARADVQWLSEGEKPRSVPDKKDLIPRTDRAFSPPSAVFWAPGRPRAAVRRRGRPPPDPKDAGAGPVTGLAPAADGGRPVSPWAGQLEIARVTGLPEDEVTAHLDRLRNRWQKSVTALTPVRDDLVDILAAHGRVLGWRQLAAGLLARRGAEIGDPAERLRLAAICVRAAVETEERRDVRPDGHPPPAPSAGRRYRSTPASWSRSVIIALTDAGGRHRPGRRGPVHLRGAARPGRPTRCPPVTRCPA